MSVQLEQFRDHARAMAARKHAPGCAPIKADPGRAHLKDGRKWCGRDSSHEEHIWRTVSPLSELTITWRCDGYCTGCVTSAEVVLWTRLADEIDAYLSGGDDEPLADWTELSGGGA